jgi:hypothetical protein
MPNNKATSRTKMNKLLEASVDRRITLREATP